MTTSPKKTEFHSKFSDVTEEINILIIWIYTQIGGDEQKNSIKTSTKFHLSFSAKQKTTQASMENAQILHFVPNDDFKLKLIETEGQTYVQLPGVHRVGLCDVTILYCTDH